MKKFYSILFCLVVLNNPIFSQIVTEDWVRNFSEKDQITNIPSAIDVNGNIYVTGYTITQQSSYDYTTIKYDQQGNTIWIQHYNGTANNADMATAIILDNSGNIYVTGRSDGIGTNADYATVKYNSAGVQLWAVRYNGTGNGYDEATAITVDNSGNVYVTGVSAGNGTAEDYATVKYNSNGVQQAVKRYNGTGNGYDKATSLTLNSSSLIVTGYSINTAGNLDIVTLNYQTTNGTLLWTKTYNGSFNGDDVAKSVINDGSNVVICGSTTVAANNSDYILLKYNVSNGNQVFVVNYDAYSSNDIANSLALDNASNIYVTGICKNNSLYEYHTLKYSNSGVQQWIHKYQLNLGSSIINNKIEIDIWNMIHVCGETNINNNRDFLLYQLNSNGVQQWVETHNGLANGSDAANDMKVDNSGHIFVTGQSQNSSAKFDYTTIKYSYTILYPLNLTYVKTDVSCESTNTGTIDITVTGGLSPYTYHWSTSDTSQDIANLYSDIYEVTVTDILGNIISEIIQIVEPTQQVQLNDPLPCSDLFISEYSDGSQHNKVLELYNPSDIPILLNKYFVRVFMNGAATPLITQLSGILQPKKTYVLTNPNASSQILAIANQTSNKINFNGDDAIQLIKVLNNININIDSIEGHGGNPHDIFDTLQLDILDQIGIPGVDPGNHGYPVGTSSTKDNTLRRNYGVTKGTQDWGCGQQQWQSMPQNDVSNLGQHQSTCKLSASPDVSLRFKNPTQTTDSITGKKYFSFDVEVKASSDSGAYYFNRAQFFIKFNIHSFGSNVNATIQRGSLIADSITYNTFYLTNWQNDNGEMELRTNIHVLNQNPSLNRIILPTTFTKLAHYSFEIDTCNHNTGLSFDSTYLDINSNRRDFLGYVPSAAYPVNPGWGYSSPIYENDMMNITLSCNSKILWISNFTSPVYPGTWYKGTTENNWEMDIQGIGFGHPKGNVYFKNANYGTLDVTPIDSKDIILWGDSLIKIRMPSLIDSVPFNKCLPGYGLFYVKTNNNDSVISSTPVDIPYVIMNYSLFDKKWRANLANLTNDSVGIVFYLGPSISNHPDTTIELSVRKAVKEWACQTQINMRVGGYTNKDYSFPDTMNVIHLVDLFPNDSLTLARTSSYFIDCRDNNGDTIIFAQEIDIAIKSFPGWTTWFTDTIGALPAQNTDFYSVLLHELGHAGSLDHVNYNDLMYKTAQFNLWDSIPEVNRRFISSTDADGGKDVVDKSIVIHLDSNCICQSATLYEYECGQGNKVNNNFLEATGEFKLYPNPFSYNGINISYQLNKNTLLQYKIIDFTGKEVFSSKITNKQKGSYNEHINTGHLAPGIYIFIVNYNGYSKAFKIINQ